MFHEIIIGMPVKRVFYPEKSINVYMDNKCIGLARIVQKNGKKVAKTEFETSEPLNAIGRMVMRDGDMVDEFHITALSF